MEGFTTAMNVTQPKRIDYWRTTALKQVSVGIHCELDRGVAKPPADPVQRIPEDLRVVAALLSRHRSQVRQVASLQLLQGNDRERKARRCG